MYLYYSTKGNHEYGYAGISADDPGEDRSPIYLGRVLDKERHIFKSNARGIFTYDVKTNSYGKPESGYLEPEFKDGRMKERPILLHFGECYTVYTVLYESGMMKLIDGIPYNNSSSVRALISFYIISRESNQTCQEWYNSSIAHLLYPGAYLSSQNVSRILEKLGTQEVNLYWQRSWIAYVKAHWTSSNNVLIDSTAIPTAVTSDKCAVSNHNGTITYGLRLIFVVEKDTGIPVYYEEIPGNVVDKSTLYRIILNLAELGVPVEECIFDAGYVTSENLDIFYNEDHECEINFITRVQSNDANLKEMLSKGRDQLVTLDTMVEYHHRYLFIRKERVFVGKNKDNPAWLYLCLDYNQRSEKIYKAIEKASKKNLSLEQMFKILNEDGAFGILCGKDLNTKEILPAYYCRQGAEQVFDFLKNYTKLLPLRTHNELTRAGHLLLCYIATCFDKLLENKLKESDLQLGTRLKAMNTQMCTVYPTKIVTNVPQERAADTYTALGIPDPPSLPIKDGKLVYDPPGSFPEKKKGKGRPPGAKNLTPEERAAREAKKQAEKEKKAAEKAAEREARKEAGIRGPGGRKKGSKNKKTIEKEAVEAQANPPKKRRGRPPGAKNLTPEERAAREAAKKAEKEKRAAERAAQREARKKDSKNKKTEEKEAVEAQPNPPKKRRGRPPGAKNLTPEQRAAREAAKKAQPKKPRGRPPGAKNKKTIEREKKEAALRKRRGLD